MKAADETRKAEAALLQVRMETVYCQIAALEEQDLTRAIQQQEYKNYVTLSSANIAFAIGSAAGMALCNVM
jgi:hypothetical protein